MGKKITGDSFLYALPKSQEGNNPETLFCLLFSLHQEIIRIHNHLLTNTLEVYFVGSLNLACIE